MEVHWFDMCICPEGSLIEFKEHGKIDSLFYGGYSLCFCHSLPLDSLLHKKFCGSCCFFLSFLEQTNQPI